MYRNNTVNYLSAQGLHLTDTLHRLWIEHVMWTRFYILSAVENLPDLKFVTDRLLRNPKDFADALRPLYGDGSAMAFENLLTQHLLTAAGLVNAAKAGNTQAAAQKRAEWYANADSIANALPGINPYWNTESWRSMLYDHLKMTENEAVLMLQGRYAESIAQYDAIQDEALKMADDMVYGIIKQFGL